MTCSYYLLIQCKSCNASGFISCLTECGSVVNNSLKSPAYPDEYPSHMDCIYSVPIPAGMTMNVYFADFDVEYDRFCR